MQEINRFISYLFGHKWLFQDCGVIHKDHYHCVRCKKEVNCTTYYRMYNVYEDYFEQKINEAKKDQREAYRKNDVE